MLIGDHLVLELLLLSRRTVGGFSVCPVVCLFQNLCGKEQEGIILSDPSSDTR